MTVIEGDRAAVGCAPFGWVLKIKTKCLLPGYERSWRTFHKIKLSASPLDQRQTVQQWGALGVWLPTALLFPGRLKVHSETCWVVNHSVSHKFQNNMTNPEPWKWVFLGWNIKMQMNNLLIKMFPHPLYISFNCSNKNVIIMSWTFQLNETFIQLFISQFSLQTQEF